MSDYYIQNINDTLSEFKNFVYIFFTIALLWIIIKILKIIQYCYNKHLPKDITQILNEPEPIIETISNQITPKASQSQKEFTFDIKKQSLCIDPNSPSLTPITEISK